MKSILLSIFLVLTAISAYGQTAAQPAPACTLKVSQAPSVRGVKLGMKLDDLLRLFPGADQEDQIKNTLNTRTSYPQLGVANFAIIPGNYPNKTQYAGISIFRVVTIDDRITQYTVEYAYPPEAPPWHRIDDWITKFAEAYQLPAVSNWTGDQNRSQRTLKCDGFEINASNLNQIGNVSILSGDPPWKEQQKRREAFDEKLRRDFKP